MRKKRYWVIGTVLFIFVLAAIFGEVEEDSANGNNNENNIENVAEKNNNNNDIENEEESEPENEENNENNSDEQARQSTNKSSNESKTEKSRANLSNLDVHFIDVGQADATLFQFKDNGETYNILFDAGDWNRNDVVNYLQAHSISTLDLVIISHPHADHIGQLANIIEQFSVGEVWMSGNSATSQTFQRAAEAVLNSDASYAEPRAGEIYDVGSLTLEILHPSSLTGGLNEDSISIRFTYGNVAFVLTGDAYKENERTMMNRTSVQADVLQLGHHGSNTSTDAQFLKAVDPSIAIYSAGANNSYGHPHEEVVSLVQNQGIDLYGTDVHGTIIVTTDGDSLNVSTQQDGTISPKSTSSSEKSNSKISASSKQNTSNSTSKNKTNTSKSASNCIDINSASFDEVQEIIHIGPARAEDLLDLRPFKSVDDLTRINGIGPARIDDIKAEGKACVGG